MAPLPAPTILPENIDEIIKLAHVVIFTIEGCPYCLKAKQYFDDQNVQHMEIRLDYGDEQHQKLQAKVNKTSLPQIFVGCKHIGGFDDLMASDKAGLLTELLHS